MIMRSLVGHSGSPVSKNTYGVVKCCTDYYSGLVLIKLGYKTVKKTSIKNMQSNFVIVFSFNPVRL